MERKEREIECESKRESWGEREREGGEREREIVEEKERDIYIERGEERSVSECAMILGE